MWDPEEIVASLEQEVGFDLTPEGHADYAATSRRILKENAPFAARVLTHLSLHSADEKIRLQASEKILAYILGRPDTVGIVDDGNDPLVAFTGKFIREVEDFANTGADDEAA
jgi:hypothetical protein